MRQPWVVRIDPVLVNDLLNGEFGVNGFYVGVPCVLGAAGVEKIVEFKLDATEQALMDNSANAVKGLIADLEKMGLL